MAGVDLPVRAIREQVAGAVDLIIQQSRLKDGSRRIVAVTEVVGMESDVVTLQDIYTFDYSAGRDETGRYVGGLVPTGIRPNSGYCSEGHNQQPAQNPLKIGLLRSGRHRGQLRGNPGSADGQVNQHQAFDLQFLRRADRI